MKDRDTPKPGQRPGSPSVLQTVFSVVASFFGVQSQRNYERDFSKGRVGVFIVVGLVMTAVFISTLLLIVHLALRNSGM